MGSSLARFLTGRARRAPASRFREAYLLRAGILKLLAIKDSDIRMLTLEQCRDAVDKGMHAGGAFSAVIPLVGAVLRRLHRSRCRGPHPLAARTCSSSAKVTRWRPWHRFMPNWAISTATVLRKLALVRQHSERPSGPTAARASTSLPAHGAGLAVAQGFAMAGRRVPQFDSYA